LTHFEADQIVEPLKIYPDFVYVLLCGLRPQRVGSGSTNYRFVFTDIVAEEMPFEAKFYMIAGWQRGNGTFGYSYVLRSADGDVLAQDGPYPVEMNADSNREEEIEVNATITNWGTYLIEGFLDDERSFRTRLRIVRPPDQ
jgi:hypothetical protein